MAVPSRGLLWVFRSAGFGIALFGAYLAGGDDLTCMRVPIESPGAATQASERSGVAECKLETRRWLGKNIVATTGYDGVTGAGTIRVPQTGEGAEDAWFVILRAGDTEVGRVFGRREPVQAAGNDLAVWFQRGLRGTVRIEWSSWPFGLALLGFGLVLTLLTAVPRRPA